MRAGVRSAFSRRCARKSGVGRHSLYTSRTGSGISTQRSRVTSCWMSAIGKSGARSEGPTGCFVPGWSTAGSANGRSAWMLYQAVGISDSGRTNFVVSLTGASGREAPILDEPG